MYLFVYKTTHINGRYYIGRHQTENLNDGYLGSGRWVSDVIDKASLSREILVEAKSFDELVELEEYYINLHFDDPLCMNLIKGSDGFTSEDASRHNQKRVKEGTHVFLNKEAARNRNLKRVSNGTHPFLNKAAQRAWALRRVENGTHPSQKTWTCQHCQVSGMGTTNYIRWHGDRCKKKSA